MLTVEPIEGWLVAFQVSLHASSNHQAHLIELIGSPGRGESQDLAGQLAISICQVMYSPQVRDPLHERVAPALLRG